MQARVLSRIPDHLLSIRHPCYSLYRGHKVILQLHMVCKYNLSALLGCYEASTSASFKGEEIYATEGQDNIPGSIRFGKVLGVPFAERLVGYFHRPHKLDIQFVLINESLTLPVEPEPITVGPVYEELVFSSICAETGTYVHMSVNYCTDEPVAAYDAYVYAKNDVMVTLANKLGAKPFEGSCPLGEANFF